MAKYRMLKHYRGAPASVNDVPMDRWTPADVEAHMQYMEDFAARLQETGEFVDSRALTPGGTWAVAAHLHEAAGDLSLAADLYAAAADKADSTVERNHLTLCAARVRERIAGRG